jgi:hypothetical protein
MHRGRLQGGPVNRKIFKIIETPSGNGEISKAGEHIAYVLYRLQVKQEFLIVEWGGDKREEAPSGIQDISGEITLSNAEERKHMLDTFRSNQALILHLADGRRLQIIASPSDSSYMAYHVLSSSGFVSG